jgi:hypothetical protein
MPALSNEPQPQEVALVGKWVAAEGRVVADATCQRIQTLVERVLERLVDHPNDQGWTTLFRDQRDGRFWELTYPESQLQGGGPPALHMLSPTEVESRYGLCQPSTSSGPR